MKVILESMKRVTNLNKDMQLYIKKAIEAMDNEDIESVHVQKNSLRGLIDKYETETTEFAKLMRVNKWETIDSIVRTEDISKNEFDSIVASFTEEAIKSKELNDIYKKKLSKELNILNKIGSTRFKNKIDLNL